MTESKKHFLTFFESLAFLKKYIKNPSSLSGSSPIKLTYFVLLFKDAKWWHFCNFLQFLNFKSWIGLDPDVTRSNRFNSRIFAPDLDVVEGRDPACAFRQEDGLEPGRLGPDDQGCLPFNVNVVIQIFTKVKNTRFSFQLMLCFCRFILKRNKSTESKIIFPQILIAREINKLVRSICAKGWDRVAPNRVGAGNVYFVQYNNNYNNK